VIQSFKKLHREHKEDTVLLRVIPEIASFNLFDMMDQYLIPLIKRFEAARDTKRAESSKHYVRDQYEFLGLDAKKMRSLLGEFIKEYGYPASDKLGELARTLWKMTEREYQNAAIEILRKKTKLLRKTDIVWIEELIITKSWWDTVDGLAVLICGDYFNLFPEQIVPVTGKWINSGNIWLMRSALLFQLKYKSATDTDLLSRYIIQVADHKDFFIRKAIGWILREYSKKHPAWVKSFVEKNSLSGLSYREATKYI
jgi:3-methyladenine DNA glycosylase AlkD